ncbi:MAG: hypothetical protein IPK13_09790 [Deltaproteobacteria bacterium]|nr:hypothetical protein [Deltaproteobacteria bacterium]
MTTETITPELLQKIDACRRASDLAELAPRGDRRLGANPHANGMLPQDLRIPDFREYAAEAPTPGVLGIGDTRVLGTGDTSVLGTGDTRVLGTGDTRVLGPFLRDVAKLDHEQRNFRIYGPDETLSAGFGGVFEATKHLPELKIRVVNVVDLTRSQPESERAHRLSDAAFDALLTKDRPVIFAFHAYPWGLIHRLTYRRTNHENAQLEVAIAPCIG